MGGRAESTEVGRALNLACARRGVGEELGACSDCLISSMLALLRLYCESVRAPGEEAKALPSFMRLGL